MLKLQAQIAEKGRKAFPMWRTELNAARVIGTQHGFNARWAFIVGPLFSWSAAYLPAFLVVREVAVSREASCTELLPGVGVLIGLVKMSRTKTKTLQLLLSQLQLNCVENVDSAHRMSFNAHVAYNSPLNK